MPIPEPSQAHLSHPRFSGTLRLSTTTTRLIMGLDMYLYAQKYVPSVNWSKGNPDEKNTEFDKLAELVNASELIDKSCWPSAYVKVEIAYWRKANAIHKYFVDVCADGKDECQDIYVEREELVELLNRCNRILENKDTQLAKELLPPQSGFFFGSTEIDEYYFEGLQRTQELLTKILNTIKEDSDLEFIYCASW